MQLPKFFTIFKTPGFKFYKNTIMFPSTHSYEAVNVIKPLMNATIVLVSKHSSDRVASEAVMSKESLSRFSSFKWSLTGYELIICVDGTQIAVPGIHFSDCESNILPSGSPICMPPSSWIRSQNRASPYEDAEVVLDLESSIAETRQLRVPVAQAEAQSQSLFPAHVKRLLIADSISRAEECAITVDLISQENACITDCGHVFSKIGLSTWLSTPSSGQACPMCRHKCIIV
jgi:hypothetical protein